MNAKFVSQRRFYMLLRTTMAKDLLNQVVSLICSFILWVLFNRLISAVAQWFEKFISQMKQESEVFLVPASTLPESGFLHFVVMVRGFIVHFFSVFNLFDNCQLIITQYNNYSTSFR